MDTNVGSGRAKEILRRIVRSKIFIIVAAALLLYDLCRRIQEAGFEVHYWPDMEITHIGGASSETVDEQAFSSSGKQLILWRMRSQLLYYHKWHGPLYCWLVMCLEQCWHHLRAWQNTAKAPDKVAESKRIVQLWRQAWQDTQGARVSPPQPW